VLGQQAPVTIINEAADGSWWVDWLPLLGAALALLVGAIVQFRLQRREFNNRTRQWSDQQAATAEQWVRTRELEREKQLLPERVRFYGDFIAALDDALVAGLAAAERVIASEQGNQPVQPSLAHMTQLLEQLGAPDVLVRQTAIESSWESARTAADRAGARAILVTADNDHRSKMQAALFTMWNVNPIVDPYSFVQDDTTVGAGDAASDVRDARLEVERAALHELGFGLHSSAHG
jgi:hypothetical protein